MSALTWAAVGKDPGFTPLSLVEFLRRRGRHRPEDMARLNLAVPFDPVANKELWLDALADAEAFARSGPTDDVGCLYYSPHLKSFNAPDRERDLASQGAGSSLRFPVRRAPPRVGRVGHHADTSFTRQQTPRFDPKKDRCGISPA